MKKIYFFTCIIVLTCIVSASADRVAIYDVQYTDDPSGNSPYAGTNVTVTGIVTFATYEGFVMAESEGPWHAIYIYTRKCIPDIGDEVEITGRVTEYYNMTEIDNITSCSVLSTGNFIDSVTVDTQTAMQESYESVLVTILDVLVTSLESYGEWVINDGSAGLRVDDLNDYMYFPKTNDYFDSVTGVIFYSFGLFKLEPRYTADLNGDPIPHYALGGTVITMNDSRDIIEDAYIEIKGDRIVDITTEMPTGITVVETGGLIFPGLIDAHNHPVYNCLDFIPFTTTFTERYEWQASALYDQFKDQYYGIRNYGGSYAQATNIWKLAETRALCAGTTMIQGYNCNGDSNNDIAHQGMIINNAERWPSKAFSNTFPLGESQSYWQNLANQYYNRFVIHLSEGFSAAALQEFYTWQSWGMLDWRTAIIHAVCYGTAEWNAMANANAHLIWSPKTNWVLYETTADVPGALDAGVNVALAPDWTESGMPNMLAEMKFANEVNEALWEGQITPIQFAEFVTRNAAYAMGVQDWTGQIALNYQADIMVIPGSSSEPYQSLLNANPEDVNLTIVSGRPMYGDQVFMDQFDFLTMIDDISICGVPKKLAIRIDASSIPNSDKTIAAVVNDLMTAYDAVYPKICNFMSFDPCGNGTPTPTPSAATPTPTPPQSRTPTPTPSGVTATPTPTNPGCDELGVTVWMPSNDFGPGDPCALEAHICNPSGITYINYPLFVILDIYGTYYFAPSYSSYDYYTLAELPPGLLVKTIIPEFPWPDNVGSADNILVYGAMTTKDFSQLFGNYGFFSFGWHSSY
ncbi:amidohydrolase family protein [bacterium]|nr:amidohydrolase family protein [candidate division CSSED10-310 bacterium]